MAITAIVYLWSAITSFDEHWGTNRGKTWSYSMDLYGDFGIKDKLFGLGPEMLRDSYGELALWFNRSILSAHSEPLQILLTMGAIGLILWIAIWFFLIKRSAKAIAEQSEGVAFALALLAYFGQSLVNGAQVTNVAILIVIVALFLETSKIRSSNAVLI